MNTVFLWKQDGKKRNLLISKEEKEKKKAENVSLKENRIENY